VLDPTAQFDLVIGGTLMPSSGLVIGSPNYPALLRTYIGGTATLDLSAAGTIAGNLYAAYGPVSLSSDYRAVRRPLRRQLQRERLGVHPLRSGHRGRRALPAASCGRRRK
jgi:hypothetical protein